MSYHFILVRMTESYTSWQGCGERRSFTPPQKKKRLIDLTSKSELQRERELFPLLVHIVSGNNGQSWDNTKLGAKNFPLVSYIETGDQALGHPPLLSQTIIGN